MKYKGLNVPDVGEFVSYLRTSICIRSEYCQYSAFKNICAGIGGTCKGCLFTNTLLTLEWHEDRKGKEAK